MATACWLAVLLLVAAASSLPYAAAAVNSTMVEVYSADGGTSRVAQDTRQYFSVESTDNEFPLNETLQTDEKGSPPKRSKRQGQMTLYVVGGTETTIRDFPWQVSLQSRGRHKCGGTILSSVWVLTAAHCIRMAKMDAVRAGSDWNNGGGSIHRIVRQRGHKRFQTLQKDYDIAALEVSPPFIFSQFVQPVQSLAVQDPVAGTRVTATGWGDTSESRLSSRLMKVTVVVQDRAVCQNIYGGEFTERMFCASSPGKDACQGDSGGPLVDERTGTLVGVVSWGIGCARADYPGVYTSVARLRKWIKRKTHV